MHLTEVRSVRELLGEHGIARTDESGRKFTFQRTSVLWKRIVAGWSFDI